MLIGLMSDTHGDAAATRRALALFDARGVDTVFHCGDLCGDGVLDQLAGRSAYFVWGNCDAPNATTRMYVESIGLTWPSVPLRVTLDGRRIAMCHGHEAAFRQIVEEEGLDYVFHGHTHQWNDWRQGNTRIINPGALHRASVKTVATLDLATDSLEFLTLDGKHFA